MKAHDLVHNGVYRHKETGDIYRLSLDEPPRLEPVDDFGTEYELDFFIYLEPVPLTPEVVEGNKWGEYHGMIDEGPVYGTGTIIGYFDHNGFYWPKLSVRINYAHEFQRLYLALTGNPLEWRAGS